VVGRPVISRGQPTVGNRASANGRATVTDKEFAGRNSMFQMGTQMELQYVASEGPVWVVHLLADTCSMAMGPLAGLVPQ